MGKASRRKRERRAGVEAEFEVFCPGSLEVLSIGKGDLKMRIDVGKPEDRDKAKVLIEEMLRKGYSIFVETDAGPVRVNRFNADAMEYVIYEVPEPEPPQTAMVYECPACRRALPADRYDLTSGVVPGHRRGPGRSPFCKQEGQPLDAEAIEEAVVAAPKNRRRERRVPVAGSRATAVGRTAGG